MVTSPRIATALDRLLAQGCRSVEVDMSGVTFLSAAGLSVFVKWDSRYRNVAAQLVLVKPSRVAARSLRITDLDLVLTVR